MADKWSKPPLAKAPEPKVKPKPYYAAAAVAPKPAVPAPHAVEASIEQVWELLTPSEADEVKQNYRLYPKLWKGLLLKVLADKKPKPKNADALVAAVDKYLKN